jgi:hypothetical protein
MNIGIHRVESIESKKIYFLEDSQTFVKRFVVIDDKGHKMELVLFADDRMKLIGLPIPPS